VVLAEAMASTLWPLVYSLVLKVFCASSFWYVCDISTETLKPCFSEQFMVHYVLNKIKVSFDAQV